MTKLNFTYRQVTNAFENKLRLDFRSGSERTAWYELDGAKVLIFSLPKVHRGTVRTGTMKQIVKSSRLTREEFKNLVECPMSGRDYEEKMRRLKTEGLI